MSQLSAMKFSATKRPTFKALLLLLCGLSVSIIINGCGGDDNNPINTSPDAYSGRVFNAQGLAVRGASITLTPTSGSALTATTNDTGYYGFRTITAGSYTLGISATGYTPLSGRSVTVATGGTRIDSISGTASGNGRIINSLTGTGLANAVVSFNFGTDTATGRASIRATTNSSGEYTFSSAPLGNFVCIVRANNFTPAVINGVEIRNGSNAFGQSVVTQVLTNTLLRIVLTWGTSPSDLDSHLTGPDSANGGRRYHVYYGNRIYRTGATDTTVILDVDDTNGEGPETVSINRYTNGRYRYTVHNYSLRGNNDTTSSNSIARSPTTVRVYDRTGLIKTYTAPVTTTPGNAWRVFEMTVANGVPTILDSNRTSGIGYVFAPSVGDTVVFRPNGGGSVKKSTVNVE
jgi:hypothetical protein